MAINDLYQIVFYTRGARGQKGYNVTYFEQSAGAGTPDVLDMLDAIDTEYTTDLAAAMNANALVYGYRGQKWNKATNVPAGVYGEKILSPAVAGGVAGNPMPGAVAGIITSLTSIPGKSWRGRFYVPFMSEADNDNDQLPNAASAARMQTLADHFDNSITFVSGGNNYAIDMVVYSRQLHTVQAVTEAFPRDRWASQRKRQWNKFL